MISSLLYLLLGSIAGFLITGFLGIAFGTVWELGNLWRFSILALLFWIFTGVWGIVGLIVGCCFGIWHFFFNKPIF